TQTSLLPGLKSAFVPLVSSTIADQLKEAMDATGIPSRNRGH
ncbi:hypothetical protein JCM6882_002640, partial [Rhodosporidiobolus microsporus]